MNSLFKKVYLLISPHIFWFLLFILILEIAIRISTDTKLFEVYSELTPDAQIGVLALLGASFGFLYKTFSKTTTYNTILELFDFSGKAINKNHPVIGQSHIQSCATINHCHDWHIRTSDHAIFF